MPRELETAGLTMVCGSGGFFSNRANFRAHAVSELERRDYCCPIWSVVDDQASFAQFQEYESRGYREMWEQRIMDVSTINAKVKQSISQVTGIDAASISDSAAYDQDLGLDSLAILEVVVSVEEHFRFKATDDELASIRTVGDTIELVRRRTTVEVA